MHRTNHIMCLWPVQASQGINLTAVDAFRECIVAKTRHSNTIVWGRASEARSTTTINLIIASKHRRRAMSARWKRSEKTHLLGFLTSGDAYCVGNSCRLPMLLSTNKSIVGIRSEKRVSRARRKRWETEKSLLHGTLDERSH